MPGLFFDAAAKTGASAEGRSHEREAVVQAVRSRSHAGLIKAAVAALLTCGSDDDIAERRIGPGEFIAIRGHSHGMQWDEREGENRKVRDERDVSAFQCMG